MVKEKDRLSTAYSSEVETLMARRKVILSRLMSELMRFPCLDIPPDLWSSMESHRSIRSAAEIEVQVGGNIHHILKSLVSASVQILTCSQMHVFILFQPTSAAALQIYVDSTKVGKGSFIGSCLSHLLTMYP